MACVDIMLLVFRGLLVLETIMKSIVLVPDPCHLVNSKFTTEFDSSTSKPRKSQDFSLQFVEFGPLPPCPYPSTEASHCSHVNLVLKDEANGSGSDFGWWSHVKSFVGLLFGLCATIFFSLAIAISKYLNKYHVFNLGIWRSQGVFIPSVIVLLYEVWIKKSPVLEKVWPLTHEEKRSNLYLIIVRSIIGSTAIVAQFYSLNFISVGDSPVIAMSTPIFVTILAYFYLGEELGIVSIVAAFTTLLGVVIVARPPLLTGAETFDMNTLIGVGVALLSMFFTTLVFLLLRKLNEIHYSLVGIFFGGLGASVCAVLAVGFDVVELPHGLFDWTMAFALALTSFLGQSALTLAFRYEQAGPISLVRTMDVIFAFIWQFLFFQHHPDLPSIIGAFIIITTVFVIGSKKILSTLPEKNSMRRRLWFLLK